MIEAPRHVPSRAKPWDDRAAGQAIDEIVSDAFDQFGGNQFWPAHPLDEGTKDGHSSIYVGATGVVWALATFVELVRPRPISTFAHTCRGS